MNLPYLQPKSIFSVDSFTAERQRMLDTLIDNIDGLIYCTLYDNQWTMIFASVGCKELTGYDANDVMFNKLISYEEITLEADRQIVRDKINMAIKMRARFEIEYRIQHADGDIIWVSEHLYWNFKQ